VKKFLSIALLFLYTLFNSGVALSMHFCHGNLKEISVLGKTKSCCGGEHDYHNVKTACCSEAQVNLKLSVDQLQTTVFDTVIIAPIVVIIPSSEVIAKDDIVVLKAFLESNSKQNAPPYFIRYCAPILYS